MMNTKYLYYKAFFQMQIPVTNLSAFCCYILNTASFSPDNNTNKTKSFIKIDFQNIFHTPEQRTLPVRETPIFFLSIHYFHYYFAHHAKIKEK